MPTIAVRRAALAACVALVLLPSAAHAAGSPAAVSLEVQGAGGPLVAQLPVTTVAGSFTKDGDPSHSCSSTSAGGALEVGTAGDWVGTYDTSFGQYTVDAIKGEAHPFSSGAYWSLYVDGVPSQVGACEAELAAGDRVQLYDACYQATTGCFTGEPMQLTAPATVAPGRSFTVALTESATTSSGPPDYTSTTTVDPSEGASIAGATTGADGKATIALAARGPQTITATKGDRPPASATVCVTDGNDGFCGTTVPAPGEAPAPAPTGALPVAAAPATAAIGTVAEGRHFAAGRGPRTLGGTVAASGPLKRLTLRLSRDDHGRCSAYSGSRERFVATRRCSVTAASFFRIDPRADWSYLLPARLGRGRYVLDVRATDADGRVDATLQRGRNRVVFTVG